MEILVRGHRPPGRRFGPHENVHVGLQVRSQPVGLVPGDVDDPQWSAVVEVVPCNGELDFRGPAVHGRRGERFLYLTWGDLQGERFDMFRRAKLILAECGADASTSRLVADVDLSDERGCPRCARVCPPAVRWSSEPGA
jgi:hypothetical protein